MLAKLRSSTTLLSTVVTTVRTVALILLGKIIAVLLGPAGHALYGNIQNIMGVAQSLGTRSMQNGIVRFSAEERDASSHIRMGLSIALLGIGVWIGGVLLFRGPLSQLLQSPLGIGHIVAMCFSSVVVAVLIVLVARLQGRERYRSWSRVSILLILIQAGGIALAVSRWGSSALFTAYLLVPGVQLLLVFPVLIREFSWTDIYGGVDRGALKSMLGYLTMGFVSAGVVPLILLFIRWRLTTEYSIDVAGLWQGLWGLSDKGVAMVTAIFVTAYLPRLVKASDAKARGALMRITLLRAGGLVATGVVVIWLTRSFVVELLLSKSFLAITEVMALQFIGDLFRVLGWVVGMGLVAQGRTKLFVSFEVGFMVLFMGLAHIWISSLGMEGVVRAYVVESVAYFCAVVAIYRKELFA